MNITFFKQTLESLLLAADEEEEEEEKRMRSVRIIPSHLALSQQAEIDYCVCQGV